MPTDERVAKLTALARMAWPYRPIEVRCVEVHPLVNGEVWEVIEAEEDEEVCYLRASSLDSLEAALLVESGETSLRALERAGLPRTAPASESQLARLQTSLEQLANEWDKLARQADHRVSEPVTSPIAALIKGAILTLGDAFRHCAAELRERAKEMR